MVQLRNGVIYNSLEPIYSRSRRHALGGPALREQPTAPPATDTPGQSMERTVLSNSWPSNLEQPGWPETIDNPAFICYRLVTIHALLHCRQFVNFLNLGHEDCEEEDCVLCRFVDLSHAYWGGPARNEVQHAANRLHQAYESWCSDSIDAQHYPPGLGDDSLPQDPTDYLDSLVQIKNVAGLDVLPALCHHHDSPAMRRVLTELSDVLLVEQKSNSCGCILPAEMEHRSALDVPLVRPDPEAEQGGIPLLTDIMRDFFAKKTNLPSQCRVHNDPRHRGTTQKYIGSAPRILPITLVRRQLDGSLYRTPIEYPKLLRLNNLRDKSRVGPILEYELAAVICYARGWEGDKGDGEEEIAQEELNEGHFIVYTEEPDGSTVCYDDGRSQRFPAHANRLLAPHTPALVSRAVQAGRLLPDGRRSGSIQASSRRDTGYEGDAYILFYCRTETPRVQRATRARAHTSGVADRKKRRRVKKKNW